MVMKTEIAPCPSCKRIMMYELDRAMYHCINCARAWTRADLGGLGYIYPTSKPVFPFLAK